MIGWNPSFNWTHDELVRVLHQKFDIEGKKSISLDVEHSDAANMADIIAWVQEMGYEAKEINSDLIQVIKKGD